MIDLHCHVLPGIDDGPPTMEDSLALACAAAEQGTHTMVATPHVSWDWPANDSVRIAALVAEVNGVFAREGVGITVVPGAEIAMTRAGDLEDSELQALRLGGGPWLLVECPHSPAAAGFEALVNALEARGHRIVLAHPERCPGFLRDRTALERLVHRGMVTSITAGSFSGRFGRDVQRFALDLVRDGLAHNVASDAHSTGGRPPAIAAHLESAGLASHVRWLTEEVPRAVLAGESSLPPAPPLPDLPRDGFVSRLLRRGR